MGRESPDEMEANLDLDVLISQYVDRNRLTQLLDPGEGSEAQECKDGIWEGDGSDEDLEVSQHFDHPKNDCPQKVETQKDDSDDCSSEYYATPPLNETCQEGQLEMLLQNYEKNIQSTIPTGNQIINIENIARSEPDSPEHPCPQPRVQESQINFGQERILESQERRKTASTPPENLPSENHDPSERSGTDNSYDQNATNNDSEPDSVPENVPELVKSQQKSEIQETSRSNHDQP
jgi:hypothetical protein